MVPRILCISLMMMLGWASLTIAQDVSTVNPCKRLLPHLTKEVAMLNTMEPEVREGATPEQAIFDTAKWLERRDVQRQNLAALQARCGVASE